MLGYGKSFVTDIGCHLPPGHRLELVERLRYTEEVDPQRTHHSGAVVTEGGMNDAPAFQRADQRKKLLSLLRHRCSMLSCAEYKTMLAPQD